MAGGMVFFPSICLHFVLNVEKMKVSKPWPVDLPVLRHALQIVVGSQ
jgi:hypothetical protein